MKKIYNSPTVETAELHSSYMICAGSPNEDIKGDGTSMFAPRPRLDKPF